MNTSIKNKSLDDMVALDTVEKEVSTLIMLKKSITNNLSEALDIFSNISGKVIVTGMGKSGHIGKKIAASLASTGTSSFFLHPGEANHGDLGMISKNDALLAISNSGESVELYSVCSYCKSLGVKIVAITQKIDSMLGKFADTILLLPSNGEACPLNLAPTNSTTATLVVGDVITVCLMNRKNITVEDFNKRHPCGKLGFLLKKVSDVMHINEAMPLVNSKSNFNDVLIEMSAKRFGCVGYVNNTGVLEGVFTDGDLRRVLISNVNTQNIMQIMTKNPIVVEPDERISDVLELMEERKISNVFVVKNGVPIGIVHIHDLIQSRV